MPAYEPVGVDQDSKFPPRVEARLSEKIAQEVSNTVINLTLYPDPDNPGFFIGGTDDIDGGEF